MCICDLDLQLRGEGKEGNSNLGDLRKRNQRVEES